MARTKTNATDAEPIELTWDLGELPTAQHRAGLAGLVMLVQWIEKTKGAKRPDGVLTVSRLDAQGTTLRVDREGMKRLYDAAYAASTEEKDSPTKRSKGKGASKTVVPPKKTVQREVVDKKTGKTNRKTVYVYDETVPRGAFLLEEDPTWTGNDGRWVKLWRDFVWSIVRGVPAARGPYEARAEKKPTSDSEDAFDELVRGLDRAVRLAGTYYLGAQDVTADSVPFEDQVRFKFLLQFWPFAVSLYVPRVVDPREAREQLGKSFAVVVPDVSVLDTFCEEHFGSLRERSTEVRGYRPAGAVVDVDVEGALDLALRLRERLSRRVAAEPTASVVAGYEVVHVGKEGNNVRVYRSLRMEPSPALTDRYATVGKRHREFFFRRQMLLNVVAGVAWHAGFDRLAATLPHDTQFIGSKWFRIEAQRAFDDAITREEKRMEAGGKEGTPLEKLVLRVVRNYVSGRVRARTGLEYKAVDASRSPPDVARFNEEVKRAARDAFLAVRSRTAGDFREYFVGSLCSVHQPLGTAGYELLSAALRDRTDDVRTLTLLALSTVSGIYEKTADSH